MEEIHAKILNKVKELTAVESEEKLKLHISILVRKSLNFMNREDFPEELIEPFAEHLALRLIEHAEISKGKLKVIKEGDTSYEYATSGANADIAEDFLSLKAQLYRFRKVGTL